MIKRCICIGLSIAVLAAALTGCGKKEAAIEKLKLNEVVHSVFYAPQYVAIEKGFFEEEGLEIDLSVGQGADARVTYRNFFARI